MAIVKSDKRPAAIEGIAALRDAVHGALLHADLVRAGLEELEQHLGLVQESEVKARETYFVIHVPAGATEGHPLEECADKGCHGAVLDVPEGEGTDSPEGQATSGDPDDNPG